VTVYTMGVWTVKPGREEDFVAAWDALGQWTLEQGFDTHGTLVRDRSDPRRFVSFGPWRSAEDAERWRAARGFHEHFARLEETLERFEPGTYDVVMRIS
jgi:heme-degrading monooxygenase HmoA